ncbi:MAG: hypothetical protein KC466_12925, partial [Myxococcales bacterium]|nr:hypothetical protein [Myxococcales bacterium]
VYEYCGDGVAQTALGEACDDGNWTDGDGCDLSCQIESTTPTCGDGVIDAGESCDDGGWNGLTGYCSVLCDQIVTGCCGDGVVDPGEQCDDGPMNGGPGYCDATCAGNSDCGNGYLDASEECDDGNLDDGDGCGGDCRVESDDLLGWYQAADLAASGTGYEIPGGPPYIAEPGSSPATSTATTSSADGACSSTPDITDIFPDDFDDQVEAYQCPSWEPAVFISGIQPQDNTPRLFGDWDLTTGNIYQQYAARGANNANSSYRHWTLINFYNRHNLNDPIAAGGSLEVIDNPASFRMYNSRRMPPLGVPVVPDALPITEWGDLEEVRMIGLWLMMDDANFRAHTWPGGTFGGATPAIRLRNHRDFRQYVRDRIQNAAWRGFVRDTSMRVARAIKCGRPIFAHSGGGAAIGLVMRLLAVEYGTQVRDWANGATIHVYGLEAVMTSSYANEAMYSDFSPYQNLIDIQNGIFGATGSADTWVGTIGGEITALGETAYSTVSVMGLAAGALGGHAMIGLAALENGTLPGYPFQPLCAIGGGRPALLPWQSYCNGQVQRMCTVQGTWEEEDCTNLGGCYEINPIDAICGD